MPSTPLIASSRGAATVSASTRGLAPGNCARTCTEGGETSGYSEIGRNQTAMAPATNTSSESTADRTGRSMKRRDRSTLVPAR